MGRFFNPAEESALESVGRKLTSVQSYASAIQMLNPGEELVRLYDRGMFKFAPFLPNEKEYEEFQGPCRRGLARPLGFYAVPSGSDTPFL